MAESPYVVKVTAETFNDVVIEGSRERPILVDFWADWCAPCRMLMPLLAKLADDYAGKLIVAKVNTEEERDLAMQFGIRSLPTVQLFKDGQPVDQFMGALPETQIRDFLERHLPRESDQVLARFQGLLAAGDLDGAASLLEQARTTDPENPRLLLAEASLKAASGDVVGAEEMLQRLPLELVSDPEVAALKGQVSFAALLHDAPPEDVLKDRIKANPTDSEARYQLAAHRATHGDFEAALEELLDLLKRDRAYGDDAARKGMLMIFDMLGGDGELVSRYRSSMLNALY